MPPALTTPTSANGMNAPVGISGGMDFATPAGVNSLVTGGISSLYGSSLPTPKASPTGPTGVASSALADQVVGTQKKGWEMLQQGVNEHAQKKEIQAANNAANPKVSIIDYLNSTGQPSDFTTRAKLAQQNGISDYVGSSDQNTRLLGLLSTGGGSKTGTDTSKTTTDTSTDKTSTEGTPNPATGSTGDVYSKPISDVQIQIGNAYSEWKRMTDQIINGTFPLSVSQTAQLDATQKKFDALVQMQIKANTSYENSVALAGNRQGLNVQNPSEYLAKGQQAISDDLQKIANLDATAAKTMNDLKQSFLDKDYKMINDQYTNLQATLKEKGDSLTKLQERADSLYKDTRDYELKQKTYEMNLEKSRAEIAKLQFDMNKGTDIGATFGSTGLGKNIKVALDNMNFQTQDAYDRTLGSVGNLLKDGDIAGAKDALYTNAFRNLPVADQIMVEGKQTALKSLDRVEKGLETLKSQGINTNVFTGISQKALEKIGKGQGNLGTNKVAQDIALAIIDYRSAVSGKAFTKEEKADYNAAFPSTGNVPDLNTIKIDGLKTAFQSSIDTVYSNHIVNMGKINDTFNAYLEPQKTLQSTYTKSTPQTQASIDKLMQDNPDLTPTDILLIINQ